MMPGKSLPPGGLQFTLHFDPQPARFCVDVGRFVSGREEFVVCPDDGYQHGWLGSRQWELTPFGSLVNTVPLMFGCLVGRNYFSAVRVTTPTGRMRVLPLAQSRTTGPGDQMEIAAGGLCFQIFHDEET